MQSLACAGRFGAFLRLEVCAFALLVVLKHAHDDMLLHCMRQLAGFLDDEPSEPSDTPTCLLGLPDELLLRVFEHCSIEAVDAFSCTGSAGRAAATTWSTRHECSTVTIADRRQMGTGFLERVLQPAFTRLARARLAHLPREDVEQDMEDLEEEIELDAAAAVLRLARSVGRSASCVKACLGLLKYNKEDIGGYVGLAQIYGGLLERDVAVPGCKDHNGKVLVLATTPYENVYQWVCTFDGLPAVMKGAFFAADLVSSPVGPEIEWRGNPVDFEEEEEGGMDDDEDDEDEDQGEVNDDSLPAVTAEEGAAELDAPHRPLGSVPHGELPASVGDEPTPSHSHGVWSATASMSSDTEQPASSCEWEVLESRALSQAGLSE